jgi:hypothetical protein
MVRCSAAPNTRCLDSSQSAAAHFDDPYYVTNDPICLGVRRFPQLRTTYQLDFHHQPKILSWVVTCYRFVSCCVMSVAKLPTNGPRLASVSLDLQIKMQSRFLINYSKSNTLFLAISQHYSSSTIIYNAYRFLGLPNLRITRQWAISSFSPSCAWFR